jgi:hypothetical protein
MDAVLATALRHRMGRTVMPRPASVGASPMSQAGVATRVNRTIGTTKLPAVLVSCQLLFFSNYTLR